MPENVADYLEKFEIPDKIFTPRCMKRKKKNFSRTTTIIQQIGFTIESPYYDGNRDENNVLG